MIGCKSKKNFQGSNLLPLDMAAGADTGFQKGGGGVQVTVKY